MTVNSVSRSKTLKASVSYQLASSQLGSNRQTQTGAVAVTSCAGACRIRALL